MEVLVIPMRSALKVLMVCGIGAATLLTSNTTAAETQYFGNGYCTIKVKTFGGTQSGQTYARTDVIDWNGGCSTINAAVRYTNGDGTVFTRYGFADNSSAVSAIKWFVAEHETGRGYWYDAERGTGGWSPWFG